MKSILIISKCAVLLPLSTISVFNFTSCSTQSSLRSAENYEEVTAIAKETLEQRGLLIKEMDTTAYLIRGKENICILFTYDPENIISDSELDPIICYNEETGEEFML